MESLKDPYLGTWTLRFRYRIRVLFDRQGGGTRQPGVEIVSTQRTQYPLNEGNMASIIVLRPPII